MAPAKVGVNGDPLMAVKVPSALPMLKAEMPDWLDT
jgi:hypothetical protein